MACQRSRGTASSSQSQKRKFNVLVHCVLQGTSLCFYSILAQGLSFVRLHFSFLSAQPTVCFWTSVAGIDTDQLRFPVM